MVIHKKSKGQRGIEQDDEHLQCIGLHQVGTGADHQSRQQKKSYPRLDEPAVDTDKKEKDDQKELAPARELYLFAPEPAVGLVNDQEEHDHQQDTDGLSHHLLVEMDSDACSHHGAGDGRQGKEQALTEGKHFFLAEPPDAHHVLQQDGYAVGAVGHIGGETQEHQKRKGKQ